MFHFNSPWSNLFGRFLIGPHGMMFLKLSYSLKKGIFLMLSASAFYLIVNALASQLHLPIVQILFLQNLIALCCMIPVIRKKENFFQFTHWKLHLIRDISGLICYYFIFLALKTTDLLDVTTLHYTSPFFVPFISFFWLREHFSHHVWWSIGLGFIGIIVILNPAWDVFHAGALIALLGALSGAIALSAVRHLVLKGEAVERILFYLFAFSSFAMLPFALANWIYPTPTEWGFVLMIGLSAVANQMLLTKSFSFAPAYYLAPVAYSSIIYAALFNCLIFKVPIGLRSIIGSLFIIVGGSLTYMLGKKEAPQILSPGKNSS